jgi:membrane protein
MKPKQIWNLVKEGASHWSNDRAPSMGAALSYYSMFSIAPLLVIVISVAGLFFGADAVQGAVFGQLSDLMGEDAAKAVDEMLKNANRPETGGVAAIVSVLVLLFGASTVLAEMQASLDTIFRVPERVKENGLWKWIRSRLLTFGMVLALAFLMLISLVLSAAVSTLGKWWGPVFEGWEWVAHALDIAVSFGLLTAVFAMIYKFMPRAALKWHDVWVGAAITALLFTIGKFLIGLYLGKSSVASGFGAFGSLALVMVWVYYSAQIFLLGAEITWVYANKHGSRQNENVAPKPAVAEPEAARPADDIQIAPSANDPMIAPQARPSRSALKRHLPELALSGAFVLGAMLGRYAMLKVDKLAAPRRSWLQRLDFSRFSPSRLKLR